jgi:arylsulfatase A-like enzyme
LPEEIWNTGKILWPGQDAGWLGEHADPWLVNCEPHKKDFRVPTIALPADMSTDRLLARRSLQQSMNRSLDALHASSSAQRWAAWQSKAIDLLQSNAAQQAFAIDRESTETRERYGSNRFGQSVLMARRLVEAGVSLVQVNWTRGETDEDVAPAWDTHAKNTQRLKSALMPPMDQAYSALLEDLEKRGMLDDTLVVWMGEFGRSPKINAACFLGGIGRWGSSRRSGLWPIRQAGRLSTRRPRRTSRLDRYDLPLLGILTRYRDSRSIQPTARDQQRPAYSTDFDVRPFWTLAGWAMHRKVHTHDGP